MQNCQRTFQSMTKTKYYGRESCDTNLSETLFEVLRPQRFNSCKERRPPKLFTQSSENETHQRQRQPKKDPVMM